MAKRPIAEMFAEGLTVPERVLLLYLASDTGLAARRSEAPTAQRRLTRGLIQRQAAASP